MVRVGFRWARRITVGVPAVLAIACGHGATDDEDVAFREAPAEDPPAAPQEEPSEPAGAAFDFDVVLACDGDICCPSQAPVVVGDVAGGVLSTNQNGACLVLQDASDDLTDTGKGSFVLASGGDDVLRVNGASFVHAGAGADTIIATGTDTEIFGGEGEDEIQTQTGHHIITPGEGADTLTTKGGSVVVVVRDACELAAGESLAASGDGDVLVLPVPLNWLPELGVSVDGFERVVMRGASCEASCAPANCIPGEATL